jgi:cytoskeleton protein RodZ
VTFGERLRKEREKRNITLDDVSLVTKIGTRMLRALEEEKFDQLPGGIFNKGFVRAYARYLNIDEDQAVADYLAASGETPAAGQQGRSGAPPRKEVPEHFEPVLDSQGRRSFPWGTIAALILAVAIGLTIWRHNTSQDQLPASPSPAASQPESQTQSPVNPSASSTSTQAAPAGESAGGESNPARSTAPNSGPSSAAIQSSSPINSLSSPSQNASSAPVSSADNNVPASLPGSFAVLINADDDSWISITADGRILYQGMMVAPTQRLVHAQKEVAIRAGNVGALDFSFNGKKLPAQGDAGEVKTLSFGPNGLLPSSPKPPAQ